MVLNFQVQKKSNKSKSMLYKTVDITNGGRNISYKTINMMFKHLLDEGYENHNISITVQNINRFYTIKSFDEEMYGTLDEYYANKVNKDSLDKFTDVKEVIFRIYE